MQLVVYAIIAVTLMLVSMLLYRRPNNQQSQDFQPTTLTNRGAFINVVIGTRRVGCVFGWAGDRESHEQGGGGKGFGGGGNGQTIWYESGWHQICVGPATALYGIYANGKLIWSTTIQPGTSPSGTTFEIPNVGSFTIYWGEKNQPINTVLGTKFGISSRWPYVCYVLWTKFALGSSPIWPQIEYVISVASPGCSLSDSSYFLDDLTSSGVNPATALLQLLNAPFPHGVGIPASQIDNDTLEALGTLMETEHLPCNLLIEGGSETARVIQGILQDTGTVMPQVGGRLAFLPIRSPAAPIPVLGEDVISQPDVERVVNRGDDPINRIVFTFKNEVQFSYKDWDIPFDNDADITDISSVSTQKVTIEIATNMAVAQTIANRRQQEASVNSSLTFTALRGARKFCAGQVFAVSGFGNLRVVSIKRSDDTAAVTIETTPDVYGVPFIDDVLTPPIISGSGLDPEKDVAFTFFELPSEVTSSVAIAVFRTRAHSQMSAANIYVSADGTSYSLAGTQNSASAGGLILSGILLADPDVIVVGPIFEDENGDAVNLLDLSTDTASWQAGRQIATIDDEVFYLESVTVQSEAAWTASHAYTTGDFVRPTSSPTGFRYKCTSSGTSDTAEPVWSRKKLDPVTDGTAQWEAHYFAYQMNNLIRARLGTVAAAHSTSARVFIADKTKLKIITDPIIQPGVHLYVKTQPSAPTGVVDIATVTAVDKTIQGIALNDTFTVTDGGDLLVTNLGDRMVYIP